LTITAISAETQLQLAEEPQANTQRYDGLRAVSELDSDHEESSHA
jgi:hypothetical protein